MTLPTGPRTISASDIYHRVRRSIIISRGGTLPPDSQLELGIMLCGVSKKIPAGGNKYGPGTEYINEYALVSDSDVYKRGLDAIFKANRIRVEVQFPQLVILKKKPGQTRTILDKILNCDAHLFIKEVLDRNLCKACRNDQPTLQGSSVCCLHMFGQCMLWRLEHFGSLYLAQREMEHLLPSETPVNGEWHGLSASQWKTFLHGGFPL